MSDAHRQLLPDDPLVTAYALGQLEGEELRRVEALLKADPALLGEVEAIRAMGLEMESALSMEALQEETRLREESKPELQTESAPQGLESKPASAPLDRPLRKAPARRPEWLRFPTLYYMIGSAAAACFALVVALQSHYVREILVPGSEPEMPLRQTEAKSLSPSTAFAAHKEVSSTPAHAAAPAPEPAASALAAAPAQVMAKRARTASASEAENTSEKRVLVFNFAQAKGGASDLVVADKPEIAPTWGAGATASMKGEAVMGAADTGFNVSHELKLSRDAQSVPPVATTIVASGSTFSVTPSQEDSINLSGEGMALPDLAATPVRSSAFGAGLPVQSADFDRTQVNRPAAEVAQQPVSRLSMTTGLGSAVAVRRALLAGQRPEARSVRIEELLNAYSFTYVRENPTAELKPSRSGQHSPLTVDVEIATNPWQDGHVLLRVGVQARRLPELPRPPLRLAVLVNTSDLVPGSEYALRVRETLRWLAVHLRPVDQVALATMGRGGARSGPFVRVAERFELLSQVDQLGETEAVRADSFASDLAACLRGANRVLLITDTNLPRLEALAECSLPLGVLAFGRRDAVLDSLSCYTSRDSYQLSRVDGVAAARARVLELAGEGNQVVARSVLMDVRFNPEKVKAYRLLGYEGRPASYAEALAGEVVSGQSYTALYDIEPTEEESSTKRLVKRGGDLEPEDVVCLSLRYVDAADQVANRRDYHVLDGMSGWENASENFKFAAAVAGFGMLLHDSVQRGSLDLALVEHLSDQGGAALPRAERQDFARQLQAAKRLGYH